MYTCPSSTFFCFGPACLESVPAFKNTTPGSRTVSPLWWIEIFFRLRKYYAFIRGWKKITGTAKRCNVKQSFRHRQIFLNLPRWLGTGVFFSLIFLSPRWILSAATSPKMSSAAFIFRLVCASETCGVTLLHLSVRLLRRSFFCRKKKRSRRIPIRLSQVKRVVILIVFPFSPLYSFQFGSKVIGYTL